MTDLFSWGDSSPEDQFDDDSWVSEAESICNNWRGWKKTTSTTGTSTSMITTNATINNNLSPYYATKTLEQSSASNNRHNGNNQSADDGFQDQIPINIAELKEFDIRSRNKNENVCMVPFLSSNIDESQSHNSFKDLFSENPPSLTELAARVVAHHIPFEVVERVCAPIPEQLQLRIAYWSFPDNEEDIRLYSCLANGSADEFQKGETLYRCMSVKFPLQIGFHLSATVMQPSAKSCTVAVTFDRCRITSCNCSCASLSSWCSHVVAVCLCRIYQPCSVRLRAPVSESLTRLSRDQLQKFAQYLISQSPQQLPNAQLLLDDLLLNPNSEINMVQGAPDPTAGAPANEQTKWCLDEMQLHENIRKIVIKLCVPSPIVYSDVNYLSSAAPPAATEWSSLLRPLRGREPEGLWNLLSIVREMLRRHDRNALPLLQILTEEILSCEQILLWWFSANVSLNRGYPSNSNSNTSNGGSSNNRSMHSNIYASQHACCSLCDEIVVLWRLVALNPAHSYIDTQKLYKQLKKYHLKTLALIFTCKSSSTFLNNFRPSTSTTGASTTTTLVNNSNSLPERNDFEIFSGFKPAMISCLIDWDSYPIPGITHQLKHRFYEPSLNLINHAISTTSFPLEKYIWDTSKLIESKNTNYNEYFNNYTIGSGDVQGQASGKKSNNKSSVSKNSEESSYIQNNENNEFEDLENRSDSELSSDDENLRKNNENRQVQSSRNLENQHDEVSDDDYAIYVFEDWIDIKSVNSRFRATSSAYSNPDYDLWEKIAKNSTKVQPIEDPFEILFSRAEALYAHGYVQEACRLSIRLTEELLNNPPELHFDLSNSQNEQGLSSSSNMQPQQSNSYSTSAWNSRGQMKRINRNRFNPALHQVSLLTSATLSKAAFLCQVLSENKDSHLLAFYVGLFGLELVRPPASTKALEVKLAYQEQELVTLLKRIPLCADALHVLRERAEQLRDGRFTTRGEALLPLSLASYIFEALLFSDQVPLANRLPTDEKLVFDAAVAAIGLKAKVSEAEHPLLCEGTRRQRGDLALNLLVFYKDNKERLDLIMDKLLDQEIHPIFSSKKSAMHLANSSIPTTSITTKVLDSSSDAINQNGSDYSKPLANMSKVSSSSQKVSDESSKSLEPQNVEESTENNENMEKFQNKSLKQSTDANINSENKKPNSFESSAPDTTSSDNSPTVSRRAIYHKSGKTNSGSSSSGGESSSSSSSSSDSLSAFSDKISNEQNETSNGSENPNAIVDNDEIISEKCELQQHQQNIYNQKIYLKSNMSEKFSLLCKSAPKCPNQIAFPTPSSLLFSNSISNSIGHSAFKLSRYKGKRHYPVIPNQPSEALAHFMFELAKTLLAKAGGNNTSALFTQPTSSQNCRAPHRLLHMCAFQIGLYALGLHNAVSPNWLSRTYSSHVSWITCQAMEIGHPAIEFLIDKWEGHLTPSEVASLADRASRNQDSLIIKAAAELALSCLSHAHALTPSEIQRALIQCKEESNAKLERACLAVEKAAQSGGVYPEVLFHVAREWYRLYRIESKYSQPQSNSTSTFSDSMATQPSENGNFELNSPEASLHFKVDYFDKTNSMENNEAGYLGQIESNFYPHMLTPQPSLNSYQDFNQYLFISLNSCFNNSYSPRPYNSKMNINQQQMTPLVSSYYPRPSVIFDTPPCFYPPATNPNASSSIYPSIGYSPNPSSNATFRAPQHHYYTPWMMNQAKGNSSLFPPPSTDVNCFSSKQQPMGPGVNPPPIGNSPFSIISSTPQPFVRTPLGFSPGGLVAPKNAPKSNQALLMGMDNGHSTVPNSSALQHFHNYYNIPNNDTSNLLPTRNLTAKQLGYMHSAYRVGMLAMETLSRRAYDDRQQTRYAKNPSYGEDVKWLLFIAKKLGAQCIQEFCLCALTAVTSPFVLYHIIAETVHILQSSNNTSYIQTIRSQILSPLVQKCQQTFASCIYFQIMHITSSDYDDFLGTLRTARNVYNMTPGGNIHFNDLLQSLKRTKSCKKELWQLINNAMQTI